MYNCTVQFEIKGVLEKNQLKNAVTLVAKRHESLRTAFSVDYSLDGCTPQQLILKEPQLCWTWFNVNEMADVQSEFDKLHSRVYDLKKGQTMAITLLSHSANHHTVIFGYHHLILDGFSWQFVLQEFAATFRHQSSLLSPSSSVVQYADFSRHQWAAFDDPTNAADKAYWALKLAEIPDPLPLFPCSKMDIRKPAHTVTRYTMIRRDNTFDGETTRLVKQSSSSLGATSFHFHLAAIQVFIQKLLQVDRFCIGVANANRHDVAFSNVVGMMVEVLPMIFNPDKHNPFANLITATRDNVLDTLKRSTGPPFHVALTSPSADQFQVVVNYTVGAPHDIVFNDHCVFHYQTSEEASHAQDLVITIRDNDGDDGSTFISFAAQDYLYEPVDIEALTVAYARLIQAASQDQSCLLSEYQFLQTSAAGEVSFHNPVATSIAASGLDGLPQRIAQVSRQEPDLIAIKEYQEGTVLTYDAMEKRIQGVAALLIDAGIQAGMFVVVACGSHADSVCAFLAIWRIGAVYVPVDLDHGIERVKVVVKDCQPAAILCRQRDELNYMAELVDTIQILDLTFDLPSSIIPLCETFSELCQDSPVVLLYTSGTTGVPKGVLLSNGNLKAHIQAMEQFMDLGRQVILQQSSLSFDASLFQILNALVYGGTCIMATGRRNPMELAEIIVREMITVTLAVPSEYALWLGETNVAKVLSKSTAWRYAFCGGEKMTCATTQAFTRLGLLDLELINAYGPSETSIACSMERVAYRYIGNSTDQPIPIGKPLPSYTVEILDNHLQPVPHGWSGEICIGGPGVSLGYFNRDGETRSQFIDWPTGDTGTAPVRLYRSSDYGRYMADGRLVYQGRLAGDSQVKLRGIRLELDEVSDAIVQCSQGAVANAAVVAKGDEGANTFLVGFVVLSTDHYPIITDVQSFLKILLSTLPVPVYAKPAFLLPIDRIPLMPSGKVDRRLLANKISNAGPLRRSDTTSLNLIERKLSELWEEMLPRLDVQITKESNFFNLGGNSQLMLKLHQQIYQVTSVDIPVFRLFQASTLEDMAIAIGLTSSKVHMMSKNNINWDAETGIPDTLQRHRHQPDQQQAKPQRTQRGLEVILTGATGFLGTALLEHLNQNPLVEKIHCIAVRNLDAETPPRQLSIQSPKIVVYSGNLSHPTLGLTPTEISHLTNAASCMIHNGAEISFLKSYDDLRAANVSSTKFLMQLSADSARGGIPFHYISTAAVTGHSSRETFGEESVASFQPPSSTTAAHGYVSSKWASEVFLERASAQFGIPVFIHRPSSIVGPSRPSDDVIGNVIDISRRISTIPDLRSSGWKGYFDMISVDRVAREVVNKAIESHDHRIEGFLSFIHHCGETRFKVSELMAYLEKSAPDGAVFTQVDTKHWVERARMHGLSEGVAVYLDELEKLEDDKKWLLPLLD
jgi:pseurotin A synthetase (hybrid polyketide synthase/nonribosomal peptide synthetase)